MPQVALQLMEVTGLLLILVAVGWELFLERDLSDLATAYQFSLLEKKLDLLWLHLGGIGSAVRQQEANRAYPDRAKLDSDWLELQNYTYKSSSQAEVARRVRALLFICGTLLLTASNVYGIFSSEMNAAT